MSNRFGVAFQDEEEIRARDKLCVYCHKAMVAFPQIQTGKGLREALATIEHLNFDGPFYAKGGLRKEDVVICCLACNSSRRDQRLWNWFESEYCLARNINPDTVAEPVRDYLSGFPPELTEFIETTAWTSAMSYAETWPHEYIVRERVDDQLFASLSRHVHSRGYEGRFYQTTHIYFDYNGPAYWHIENIINRCLTSETYGRREKEGRLPVPPKLPVGS